jgi:hydrogenase maturation protease
MKNLRTDPCRVLIIGIGNSGRGDDGLGWKFVEKLQCSGFEFLDFEYRYQLQIEDATLIGSYDFVIFVDASHVKLSNGFEIKTCIGANHYFFSSHMQSPEVILYLANILYYRSPKAYTLAISGRDWELKTSLSEEAEKNLESALSFFAKEFLQTIQVKRTVSAN